MVKYLLIRQRKKPNETPNEFCYKVLELTINEHSPRQGFSLRLKFVSRRGVSYGVKFKILYAASGEELNPLRLNEMANFTSVERTGVLDKIEQTVIDFFMQVMQMNSFTLRQEALE